MKCPLCPYPRVGKLKRKNGENKPRENWQMVGLSWGMKYCVPFFGGINYHLGGLNASSFGDL